MTEAPKGGDGPSPMRFAGLGIQLVVMTLLGLFAGQWADRKFGTGEILTIVGAFVGFGATMWSLVKQVGQADSRTGGQGGPGFHRGDEGGQEKK